MLKCAVVSPGFLPVPAVRGGAVESLITNLIDLNEKDSLYQFDVFSIFDDQINIANYSHSCFHFIKTSKIEQLVMKVTNKLFHFFHLSKFFSFYDYRVVRYFRKTKIKYDYILIENNMYLYEKVFKNYHHSVKYIFHLHNDIGGIDKPIRLCNFISKTAYRVLTVSDFLNQKFCQMTNCDCVKTLWNCIDSSLFLNHKGTLCRSDFSFSKDDLVFLYSGRFSAEKGLYELIQAFIKIHLKYPNTKLLVLGDYHDVNSYGMQILHIQKKYSDSICLIGYVMSEQLSLYYNIADVVVIPSVCDEAFGVVALEAMVSKKPLIVSNRGGLPEIVNSQYAILVDKEDFVQNLAEAMENMILHRENILQMGEAGYQKFLEIKEYHSSYYLKNFQKAVHKE